MAVHFKRGDLLVYKKQKQSNRPGARAHSTAAAVQDGVFSYVVDKFWIVVKVCDDDTLEVQTRGGKRHRLNIADPNLRRLTWWQRIWYRNRLRELKQALVRDGSDVGVEDSRSEL